MASMARWITTGMGRRRVAWLVPLAVVAIVATGAVVESSGASTTPRLAPRTTAQLLTAVAKTPARALSGTITETTDLGLPSLPGDAQSASLSWSTLLTGTHSIRVWVDGPARQRLAVIGELSEADIVHNGRDLWTYTSDSNTASHTVLPTRSQHRDVSGDHGVMTPAAAVAKILKLISPSTSVTLGPNVFVARQKAYTLVVTPRDPQSTVRKITIAIDSAHYVPLQVQVFGASNNPAVTVGFGKVAFARPAASTFAFRIPAGASVTKHPFSMNGPADQGPMPAPAQGASPTAAAQPRVLGSGWTSVLEVHDVGAIGGLLAQSTVPIGTSGLRLLHTALVNVVLTGDGRAFIGAVRPAALAHIAATTAR